jgi:ribosomal protein L24E
MAETCKTCKKEVESGIFLSPQFSDEKVLLFCSDKCKDEYIKVKIERIKVEYPKYYNKLIKSSKSEKNEDLFEVLQKDRK